ncbi:DUF4870 domain-containing protein [Flavobacterium sp. 2]|uniref:DUF4870 domain-containing protein n=1 Tax=Flavobacterium sp. 2 TaxID=308053 RepID=UPI003CF9B541
MKMNRKTISIISYLTIIGWMVSYMFYYSGHKSILAHYHLKQSFGLGTIGFILCTLYVNLILFFPLIYIIFIVMNLLLLLIISIGISNAVKERKVPLPFLGLYFDHKFDFIKY